MSISLPTFNIGIRSFAEATSQLSRSLDIIRNAFQLAVTLVDIANAVRSGELTIDRIQTANGLAQMDLNGFVFIRNRQAGTNAGHTPIGGGILFADAGALKWFGSSGTTTTVAPA